VIISGIFIGVNNTVTTQAVMTVSPVEKPVASAAYSFVRFIGGGLAPYAAGRMVLAAGIHFPFFVGAGAIVAGIVILTTAHGMLSEAERVQAEQVTGSAPAAPAVPAAALIPVEGSVASGSPSENVILAAVDGSPIAALVTEAAAILAADHGGVVHVVHTQEEATAGDVAIDGESLDAARAVVRNHLDRLAAHHVPAEGQILLHAADHGAAGRMVAEYANTIGARTIVIGAPSHGGLSAMMDGSASRELWRHARSNVLVVNPDAPGTLSVRSADAELLRG
jgi:nucleotide-binding universal stress UspA family protein